MMLSTTHPNKEFSPVEVRQFLKVNLTKYDYS